MADLDDLMAAFAGVNVDDHDELVETFARVLGTDGGSARFFLEASQWNLEVALGNFLDTVGSRVRDRCARAPAPRCCATRPPPSRSEPRTARSQPTTSHTRPFCVRVAQSNLARAGSVPRSIFKGDETVQQIGAQAFPPGQPVEMFWSFLNCGEGPWPMDAALVHTEGDPMGAQMELSVGGCQPNAEVSFADGHLLPLVRRARPHLRPRCQHSTLSLSLSLTLCVRCRQLCSCKLWHPLLAGRRPAASGCGIRGGSSGTLSGWS
jgi:hypothetical protein